jgi:hypothetical protein
MMVCVQADSATSGLVVVTGHTSGKFLLTLGSPEFTFSGCLLGTSMSWINCVAHRDVGSLSFVMAPLIKGPADTGRLLICILFGDDVGGGTTIGCACACGPGLWASVFFWDLFSGVFAPDPSRRGTSGAL